MKKLLATVLGVSCCTLAAYAQNPRADLRAEPAPAVLFGTSSTNQGLFESSPQPHLLLASPPRPAGTIDELSRLAYKISYVGSILLTADQVIRSMDSVLDRMELTRPDGSQLRLRMSPASEGFEVMLKMSRPIDF